MTGIGHNIEAISASTASQLTAFIERIERLHEERKGLGDDIKDIYAEAKANGFDTKAIKAIVAERAADPAKRSELEAIVDLYKQALGMA